MSTRRPKILQVLHTLRTAGAETLVCHLIADLRLRFDFDVAALDEAGELASTMQQAAGTVAIMHRRPGMDWRCVRRLARLIDRRSIDLIHAHQYTPLCYAALAGRWSRRRPKLLFTEHGRHYPDRRRFKRIVANRLLFNGMIDRITAVGQFVKQALVTCEAFDACDIEIIYNGIRPERFDRADLPDGADMRKELNLPADRPVIMHVGGLRPVKDHGSAVEAVSLLHQQHCPAVLVCVGDGPERKNIERQSHRLGVAEAVKLIGWRSDVQRLWRAADVALNCSLSEGVSVAMLEAMASARAVVATDVGGNGEIVVHGQTGLLTPRSNPAALAEAMATLMNDPVMRSRFGQAGRRRVVKHFHQADMHAAYENLYDQLTHHRRQRPAPVNGDISAAA